MVLEVFASLVLNSMAQLPMSASELLALKSIRKQGRRSTHLTGIVTVKVSVAVFPFSCTEIGDFDGIT